jgi:large subunit ribosomal protein L10
MATKAQKESVVSEIVELLKSTDAIYLTDYTGMSVAQISTLRKEFRKHGVTYRVYKNTLVKKAMESLGGYEGVFPHLNEQTAFAFMSGDASVPGKVLKEYLKKADKPKFKSAYVDGSVFGSDKIDALASMKSKNEVLGEIIGLLLSPMSNVIGALQSQGSGIVGAIKTIAEKENN